MSKPLIGAITAIDLYHGAAILDLKRGWTGIRNVIQNKLCILKMVCALFMPVKPRFKSKMRDKGLLGSSQLIHFVFPIQVTC